jgi:hypothetical protein
MAITDPWVECFFVGALQMRCSVVTDRSTGDTVIIDGGSEPGSAHSLDRSVRMDVVLTGQMGLQT